MKTELACCKFAAFEHFRMYKHPSLSVLPALLLLLFLPTLQEHKFLAVAPFAGVFRDGGLYRVKEEHMGWEILMGEGPHSN